MVQTHKLHKFQKNPNSMLMITGPSWRHDSFSIIGQDILLPESELNSNCHKVSTASSLWDGCIVLSKYLECVGHWNGLNVLELGAGRGLVSLAAAVLGAHVLCTDVGDVIPWLDKSIELNDSVLSQNGGSIVTSPLDWTKPFIVPQVDYVLAADVVWVSELIEPLVKTIFQLLENGKTRMLLAHQTRSLKSDHLFFTSLDQLNIKVQVIPRDEYHPVYQSDKICIYRLQYTL